MYNGPVNKERYEMKAVFKGYKKKRLAVNSQSASITTLSRIMTLKVSSLP
jgi:hypothetical protein